MSRLLDLPEENLTSEQKSIFDHLVAGRGRILGPYRIWIHSPTIASGMEQIGTFLNNRASISKREVEMGVIIIAQHWKADYVLSAHTRLGKALGLSEDVVDALLCGREPPLGDPHEQAFCRFARALVAGTRIDDGEYASIEGAIGRDGIAETLVLLGYYTSVAMGMKVHEVPIPHA